MRPRRLLRRLLDGSYTNVKFNDFQRLAEACGFELDRVAGSHHIYAHPDVPVKLSIQSVRGDAKPYQLRQFRQLVERYDLISEELR
jgi:predicted RNA binding protein YcfA (HicA-like mRNA interferase family)